MSPRVRRFARWGLWLLPVWAALLFLGTLTHQPDPQTEFPAFAEYVTTDTFLVSHLVNSILGAAIGSIGVVALAFYLHDSVAGGRAVVGMVATVLANTLNTAVFGTAAFAQRGLGQAFLAGQQNAQEIYNLVYAAPLIGTVIVALLAQIIGGVFTGLAIGASGRLPRWAGWLYAIALVGLALSVFLMPEVQSVVTGLLIIATVAIAWSAARQRRPQGVSVGVAPQV